MTLFEELSFTFGPILFGLAGFIVASYVSHKKKTAQPMVCPLNGDCETVTSSAYSKFFGLPVERIGVFYYALIVLVYGVHALIPWLLSDTIMFFVMGLSIGAFVFSLYLIFIQAFVLKKWCTWCLFSAAFSTFIFITSVFGSSIDLPALLTKYKMVIVILHALGAAVGVGAATVTDIFFFRFLRDYRISKGEHELMKTLSNIIWFALGLIVVTGIGLFIPRSAELLQSSKFLIKIVAVGVVIVNGVFLNLLVSPRLMEISFGEGHDHKSGELKFFRKLSFALGAISITSWYTIFVLGNLKSIPVDFRAALGLYILLLCFAVTMSQLFDKKMRYDFARHQKENPVTPPENPNENL